VLRLFLMAVASWWADQRQAAIAYLVEENRSLRAHLRGRVRLTEEERRRLAMHGRRLGRRRPRSGRDDCHPRHDPALASAARRAEMDVRHSSWTSRRPCGDPRACHPDGGRESDVGLHADPRRVEKHRTSGQSVDDRADSQGTRDAARTGAPHLVANIPPRALGRHRWRRFFHHRGLDVARVGDVLHGLRDRSRIAPRPDCRIHAVSWGSLHVSSRAHTHSCRCGTAPEPPRADLRPRPKNGMARCDDC
jgi:hypothetical protein